MPRTSKPKLYCRAVAWIADNDETAETEIKVMAALISVLLVADLFGKEPETVAFDVVNLRETRALQTVPTAWSRPRHPGDMVRSAYMRRGAGDREEIGCVAIQWYAEHSVRVGTFLPGRQVCNEGDTPKTEPERAEYLKSRDAADSCFEEYLQQAVADGWRLHTPG